MFGRIVAPGWRAVPAHATDDNAVPIKAAVSEKRSYEAAAAGDTDAMLKLGALYQAGNGVEQDYAAAKLWSEKAANAGNAGAVYSLGVADRDGQGTAADPEAAKTWFAKAADGGVTAPAE